MGANASEEVWEGDNPGEGDPEKLAIQDRPTPMLLETLRASFKVEAELKDRAIVLVQSLLNKITALRAFPQEDFDNCTATISPFREPSIEVHVPMHKVGNEAGNATAQRGIQSAVVNDLSKFQEVASTRIDADANGLITFLHLKLHPYQVPPLGSPQTQAVEAVSDPVIAYLESYLNRWHSDGLGTMIVTISETDGRYYIQVQMPEDRIVMTAKQEQLLRWLDQSGEFQCTFSGLTINDEAGTSHRKKAYEVLRPDRFPPLTSSKAQTVEAVQGNVGAGVSASTRNP